MKLNLNKCAIAGLIFMMLACNNSDDKQITTVEMRGISRCEQGICLVYIYSLLDSDWDGFSDQDETAMGTDPKDPKSYPGALKVIEEIGKGRLESFNMGYSELVILPEKSPDGKELNFGATIISGYKSDALGKLGIKKETLSRYGLSFDTGFTLLSALPELKGPATGSPDKDTPPKMKIGGIDPGTISQEESFDTWFPGKTGFGRPKYPDNPGKPDGGAPAPHSEPKPQPEPQPDPKPSGGTNDLTTGDPEGVSVLFITKQDFDRIWYKTKGGDISRTGPDVPRPEDGDNPIIGEDPNGPIILTVETEVKIKNAIIVFPVPAPRDKREQNTTYGPIILDLVKPGSGVPPENPTNPTEPPRP